MLHYPREHYDIWPYFSNTDHLWICALTLEIHRDPHSQTPLREEGALAGYILLVVSTLLWGNDLIVCILAMSTTEGSS